MEIRAEDATAAEGSRHARRRYDVLRPTTEPHDVLIDKEGNVWYTDFGEMFIGKFDPKTLKLTEYSIKKFKEKAPTRLCIPVLRVLYQKYHHKRYDRRSRIDDKLPCVREVKQRTGGRPDNNSRNRKRAKTHACPTWRDVS